MRRILSIAFICCALSQGVFAQVKTFTPDHEKFLEELSNFMIDADKKEGKKFTEHFTEVWNGELFDGAERRMIYGMCNYMLSGRMTAYPDFSNFFELLEAFKTEGHNPSSYTAWKDAMNHYSKLRSKSKFERFLDFSHGLVVENAIYKSSTTLWETDSKDYFFQFEKDVPTIEFVGLKLVCLAKNDSSVIRKTSGKYYPEDQKWVGYGGVVDWQRAGFDPNEVYAELGGYKIAMKSPYFEVDSVIFHNKQWFDKPLQGRLVEKVLANVTEEKASYPRFYSYDKRLKIYDFIDNVDYDGGFSQWGSKFLGSGSEEEFAKFIFYRDGLPFLVASSENFIIRPENVSSQRTGIVLYLDGDSITHPSVKFNLKNDERVLSLVKSDEGAAKTPYTNTYHNLDMQFESMTWKIDDALISFGAIAGATEKRALFESKDFYREYRFDKLMGLANVHPLVRIKDCSRSMGDLRDLSVEDISQCLRMSQSQIKLLLMDLAVDGYMEYDYDRDRVYLKDKLFHYIAAKSKKADYDVIEFRSDVGSGSNAQLDLLGNNLRMYGVDRVFLSDTSRVVVYPTNRELIVKKNRDFIFSGVVAAGKFEFFGNSFSFSYDKFKVDMPNIDSVRLNVYTGEVDEYGKKEWRRVKTVIQHATGELLIDKEDNKSHIKPYSRYPIFNSLEDSYTFYDGGDIQGGIYKKNSFYFHLEPFSFDSLLRFDNRDIQFKGTFTSAGIFPDFEETLSLQPDYSLGFVRATPPEGFEIYQGAGRFNDDIKLSHGGLRGDGTLDYLTSTSESNDIYFYPDSVNAVAQNFIIEEQISPIEYPPVYGRDAGIHWEPKKEFLEAFKIDKPITIYDQESKLHGMLTLTPQGLTGEGMFAFEGAELTSQLMKFKFSDLYSDTASFKLKNDGGSSSGMISFATDNVNAHVDFKERKGDFVANGGGSFIEFPQNQYIAFMDKFIWYMDSDDIELSATTKEKAVGQDVQLEGSKFISMHEDQDSLTFYSPAAKYDVKNNIISAREVKFIFVADALLYPDSGLVTVLKKAKMKTLENAKIVANNITKYHTIYNASINVLARKDYLASGDYDYIDEDQKVQTVHLSNVKVDSTYQTYATGGITADDEFTLSPRYRFKGEVELFGSREFLNFKGRALMNHDCEDLKISWFGFKGEIDPNDIYIPIDTLVKDDNGKELYAGMALRPDSTHIYTTFVSKMKRPSDLMVLDARGFLHYNKSSNQYFVSNLEKLNQPVLPGNYLKLDNNTCQVYGEGKLDFAADLGQVHLHPYGSIIHHPEDDTVGLSTLLILDFFIADNALDHINKQLKDAETLPGINYDNSTYRKGLQEIVGKEEADKLLGQIDLYGAFKKLPEALEVPIFLADVKFEWNSETGSYRSVGPIGIGNILKKQVNKYVEGKIEIIKKRSGDIMHIYLEITPGDWYYFNYTRGLMQTYSSNQEYIEIIKALKADKKKMKVPKGETPYSFMLSTERKKEDFLRRFEQID